MIDQDTICAITTAPGIGAIAVVRLSGNQAITIADSLFRSVRVGKCLADQKGNSLHFGQIVDKETVIDEVLVSVFRNPHSFTGEDVVEIACHGSIYIQQTLLQLFLNNGARMARPGEFTQRAFLNGKMDLSQAEAVADLVSASSKAAHNLALKQMKGGISDEIKKLREELLTFVSLVELELDFSEEDVEFADRTNLSDLAQRIETTISKLASSFSYGNAIKNGIPVAIIGDANVGKSTLLNALLNEDRAIVSHIAGTTRDVIEDVTTIDGMQFRFIDTAGIRSTNDEIETIGIERTYAKIEQAEIVLTMIDASRSFNDIVIFLTQMSDRLHNKNAALVINKIDVATPETIEELINMGEAISVPTILISAKSKKNIDQLTSFLVESMQNKQQSSNDVIITNMRHYQALTSAHESIARVIDGLKEQIPTDLLAQDIRECLYHLGSITGEIATEEVLSNIFKHFCIGK